MEVQPENLEKRTWTKKVCGEIAHKTTGYSEREKKNLRISFLLHAIEKVADKDGVVPTDWREFQGKVEQVIQHLPMKSGQERLVYGGSLKAITQFKTYVLKKFNYVSKGSYLKIWLFLTGILGLIIGALTGYLLPGVLLGVGIGLVMGSYQDKKAAANNRVL